MGGTIQRHRLVMGSCTHRFLVVSQYCVEGGAELGMSGGLQDGARDVDVTW